MLEKWSSKHSYVIDFFSSNYSCCFRYNQLELNVVFIYVSFSSPKLSLPTPWPEGSKHPKNLEQYFCLRFAILCAGIINKVSQEGLSQVYKHVPIWAFSVNSLNSAKQLRINIKLKRMSFSKRMLWRASFQNGFLIGAWFDMKVPFLVTLVIYFSRVWLIILKHCWETVFFSKPYVGWQRRGK